MPKVSPYSEQFKAGRRGVVEVERPLAGAPAQGARRVARVVTSDELEELRRLRREVKVLAEEREILKSRGLLRQGQRDAEMIFRFVAPKEAEHSIKTMCRVLEVSRSHMGGLAE